MESWYKLTIAYDGTDYYGWQWQDNKITVAQVIKKTFLALFNQEHVYLVAASRTDTGVHANGQVIRIGTALALSPEKLIKVMNNALPQSIVIIDCHKAERIFHPQHQVAYKTYSYHIFTHRPCPQKQRYGYFYWHPIDRVKLDQALQIFVGTHDFKRFAKQKEYASTIRTIQKIETAWSGDDSCTIFITGVSFLQYMVRRVVGAALAIASDPQRSVQEIQNILEHDDVSVKNLPKAPAKGLCLEKIMYKDVDPL